MKRAVPFITAIIILIFLLSACSLTSPAISDQQSVPHEGRWGIYRLDLDTQATELIFSSAVDIPTIHLNNAGDRLVFSMKIGAESNQYEEIFSLKSDGSDLARITDNGFWDLYPVWSPDGSKVAFLSMRETSLGIFSVNMDGSQVKPLYDSDSHDSDIDWRADQIAFTRDSSIWIMNSDGTDAHQISFPPRAGEWGQANLPFGDYDPRISPDGSRVVFERLLDDQSPHGNYDLFIMDKDGSNERRLTNSGYSQGLSNWSHDGNQLLYIVGAVGTSAQYDLYIMNSDGGDNQNITPSYFPPEFLCKWATFSRDDASIYFVGEWWQAE